MPRCALILLAAAVGGAAPARGAETTWQLIDVQSRLDDEGRLHVVETVAVETGLPVLDRELGLSPDQSFALQALSRLDEEGAPTALEPGDPDQPGRFQAYPRHLRWSTRSAGAPAEGRGLHRFRIEYELRNAVLPAWGFGTGPEPLVRQTGVGSPLARWRQQWAEWREAWPAGERPWRLFARRYRLDHDVLLPSRDGPGVEFRQIDYRLEYSRAWRAVQPDAELGKATPDSDYRVRMLLDFLPSGRPAAAAWREAAIRWGALLAVPLLGLASCAALWLFDAARLLSGPRRDPDRLRREVLALPPEVIRASWTGERQAPTVQEFLSRLEADGRITVELSPPGEEEVSPEVRMRLRDAEGLSEYEGQIVDRLFPRGPETSSALLRSHYAADGFDPDQEIATAFATTAPKRGAGGRQPLATAIVFLLALGGAVFFLRELVALERLVHVALAGLGFLLLGTIWPGRFWHVSLGARPLLALLLPLPLLVALILALHFLSNSPLGIDGTVGASLGALACYQAILVGARIPATGERGRMLADLASLRRFGRAELRRPSPCLEPRWLPRLEAVGLGRELERWRGASGPAGQPVGTGDRPADWADALWVAGADEDDEEDVDDDDEEEAT